MCRIRTRFWTEPKKEVPCEEQAIVMWGVGDLEHFWFNSESVNCNIYATSVSKADKKLVPEGFSTYILNHL